MKLFRLGVVPPTVSQACYHALARLGVEGLVTVTPSAPYVCLGYFQDAESSVDLDYCARAGLPVLRREVGGGTVLLDSGQVFYQVVLDRSNPFLPADIEGLYDKFSQGAIRAYHRFGLRVERRPVNDLVTSTGMKISGQGAADIGPCRVFVGSLIVDFDYDTMARALRVPDEKYRDKLHRGMRAGLTTLHRELGYAPPRDEVERAIVAGFSAVLGPLEEAPLPQEVEVEMGRVAETLAYPSFVLLRRRPRGMGVKISAGMRIGRGDWKAPGGLITAVVNWEAGASGGELIREADIYGDFTLLPAIGAAELGRAVTGLPADREMLAGALHECFGRLAIDAPGMTVGDVVEAIMRSAQGGVTDVGKQ